MKRTNKEKFIAWFERLIRIKKELEDEFIAWAERFEKQANNYEKNHSREYWEEES